MHDNAAKQRINLCCKFSRSILKSLVFLTLINSFLFIPLIIFILFFEDSCSLYLAFVIRSKSIFLHPSRVCLPGSPPRYCKTLDDAVAPMLKFATASYTAVSMPCDQINVSFGARSHIILFNDFISVLGFTM